MLKRLPSRNQRSKGIKAKHALQICLLIGVCFWLIYQVKHSHDKKKEFDENDAKSSIRRVSDSEILKLGRKDLHPHEEMTKIEKHEVEEEEETPVEEEEQHEEEREEEENKNDSQELEEEEENKNEEVEESKNEEAEDGGRGGGDDEIDENEQERKDEGNHDEDFIDEENEREEEGGDESKTNGNEEIEDRLENENPSEDQDNDGGDQSEHEAREEHYIRDDASSEVAHDSQVITTVTEKISSENLNENTETNTLEQDKSNNSREDVNKTEIGSTVGEDGTAGNHTYLDVVSLARNVDNNNNNSSNSADSEVSVTTKSNDHLEAGNNPVHGSTEAINNSMVTTEASSKLTETRNESSDSSERKKTGTTNEMSDTSQQNNRESASDSGSAQVKTMDSTTTGERKSEETSSVVQTDNSTIGSEDNKVDFNTTNSTKTENVDGGSKEFSDSSKNIETDVPGKIIRPDERAQVEDGTTSSTTKENTDASQNEKLDNKSDSNGIEEGSESTGGTEDAVQHDPIDTSDTQIGQEFKEVRTDLGTLPDMGSERVESEEVAAE